MSKRARSWDDESKLMSFNCYIDYTNGSWKKPYLQGIYLSELKGEGAWFYEGGLKGEDYNDKEYFGHSYKQVVQPFFIMNNKWQQTIIKAFRSISTRVERKCKVRIQDLSIHIDYMEGRVKKSKSFVTDAKFEFVLPKGENRG